MSDTQEKYHILAVKRAIQVLNLFADSGAGLGVSEIAKQMDVHKSIIHKILVTLESEDWVYQSPVDGKYYLGLKLLKLSNLVPSRFDFRNYARRIMEELVAETNETATLTVLDTSSCYGVCIDMVECSHSVRHVSNIGREIPLHAGASGLIMAAYMPPAKFEQLLQSSLPVFTENTITEPAELMELVRGIRKQGYAATEGQVDEGLVAMAAPILDAQGELVAGLNISGPIYRFQADEKRQRLIELVVKSARCISDYVTYTQQ